MMQWKSPIKIVYFKQYNKDTTVIVPLEFRCIYQFDLSNYVYRRSLGVGIKLK